LINAVTNSAIFSCCLRGSRDASSNIFRSFPSGPPFFLTATTPFSENKICMVLSLAVPGLGVGVGILQMCDGSADLTGSNDGGIDLSIDYMVGRSRLIESREECCN
jgi:hypothetical protein